MPKQKDYLMESDRNIFLTGKAGTGKTYRIKQYVEQMEAEGKIVLVCAPTGTAAIYAGGETCHSLFGIPVPCYGVAISKTPASKLKILATADAIVIDEVSMLRNDNFSYLIRVLRKAERLKGHRIRIILTGDFSQLPPVVPKKEEKMLKKFGYSISGYAFTTKEWESLNLKVIELTTIYRQEEKVFIENLAKIRDCDVSALDYFNQFVDPTFQLEKVEELLDTCLEDEDLETNSDVNFWEEETAFERSEKENASESFFEEENASDHDFWEEEKPINPNLLTADCVVLCGTNAEAERINRAYLDQIDAPLMAYQSSKKGRNNASEIEDVILLKEGCKVMFTTNDVVKNRYQNGTMGVVSMCHKDHVSVRLEDGKLLSVYPCEYSSYSYKISGGALEKTKIGAVKQLPLKIAAAITIHKSQGKTFEKAIISPSVFASGQLYVALSRLKSSSGLILTTPILEKAFVFNDLVSKFYQNGFVYQAPKTITKSKTVLSTEELDSKKSQNLPGKKEHPAPKRNGKTTKTSPKSTTKRKQSTKTTKKSTTKKSTKVTTTKKKLTK